MKTDINYLCFFLVKEDLEVQPAPKEMRLQQRRTRLLFFIDVHKHILSVRLFELNYIEIYSQMSSIVY